MGRWRERWIAWRNARLSDPRFQNWAARFPLTRPIARRESAALFDTVAGFVYAQVLAACVELDLFRVIGTDSIDATALDLPVEAAERLLKAAAALDLTEALGGGRYALGRRGAAMLGNPGIAATVVHHKLLYADLADPVGLLRRGKGTLADYWRYRDGTTAGAVADYSTLMAASQAMVAEQVLGAYDFGKHRQLLDVGGGEGAFLRTVSAKHPALSLALFDLPAVADRARAALDERATVHEGSFLTDPLPKGADIISLVRIVHDHDDEHAQLLLKAAHDALPEGGTLLIAEPMAETPGAEAMGDAYFGFYLLAMGSGRPRTSHEIGAMLDRVGFVRWRTLFTALPLVTRAIVATR